MAKPLSVALSVLADLRDVYKVTFKLVDQAIFHCLNTTDKNTDLEMHQAADISKVWAAPIKYQRIIDIAGAMYNQTVVNTVLSLTTLIDSYLKMMCLKALKVKPFDDTWFSFENLSYLANISVPQESLTSYKEVAKLYQARASSMIAAVPPPTITHMDMLMMFDHVERFMKDFEAAYMLANEHVREELL